MRSTPIELGALLDGWSTSGEVGLVETAAAVTVTRLSAATARELVEFVDGLDWQCDIEDQAGELVQADRIEEDFGPFVGTIAKHVDGTDRRILTTDGLRQALAESSGGGVWQVACCRVAFATGFASINPWGGGELFSPATKTKSPLDIVREASAERLVPPDIRKWLLRSDITEELWSDAAFATFAAASAAALVRCLASEVTGREAVVFSGPPRLNIALAENLLLNELALQGYKNLRAAAAWVYEDSPSAEQRHALFAAEFARSVNRDESLGKALQAAGADILEGSRLAFQLSQSDLSREAIKAQSDLRKAIADDMSKAADGTRTLSGAVAVAIVTGITLFAARSAGSTEPWVVQLIASVVGIYLIAVAGTGWAYLFLQQGLRDQWRRRFYRFVPSEDYDAMVTTPARSAELPYHIVAGIAVVVALILIIMPLAVSDPSLSKLPSSGVVKDTPGPVASDEATSPVAPPDVLQLPSDADAKDPQPNRPAD